MEGARCVRLWRRMVVSWCSRKDQEEEGKVGGEEEKGGIDL